jgi:predicted dehydrogenase
MALTPDQKGIGKENFLQAAGTTRRGFLGEVATGMTAVGATFGSIYFGYGKLTGSPLKVGFIGTGDEGSVLLTQHPPAYMDIVAVADIRPSNLQRAFTGDSNSKDRIGLNAKLGRDTAAKITRYTSHKDLLADKNVEAVVIAVPLSQHAPIAIEAMKAGKHVLCEKLMAHNVTQCKEMIKVAHDTKKLLAVGHQRHYSVLYDNANYLVKSGMLGDIKFIRACWHRNNSFPNSDSWRKKIDKADLVALEKTAKDFGYDSVEQLCRWRLYNKTGGGLMAELGSHQLDACSIFLGKRHPLAVMGYGGKNFYGVKGVGPIDKQDDDREIDDHVYVTLEFPGPHYEQDKNDIVIVTYSSINTNRFEPYGESVYGSRGTMIVEMESDVMLYKEAGGGSGGGGPNQRLKVLAASAGGGPAVEASPSAAAGAVAAKDVGLEKPSRGYTEEMEHFAHCVRTNNFEPPEKGGLRCPGEHAMADAIMAITCNLAMKHKKRITFKPEWFDPNSPAVPENDPEIVGSGKTA